MIPKNIAIKATEILGKVPKSLKSEIKNLKSRTNRIPLVINGEFIYKNETECHSPYDFSSQVCVYSKASGVDVAKAIDSSRRGKEIWNKFSLNKKLDIFEKAADLVEGKYYNKLLASTMISQGKNYYQAEIDAICELGDFWRFNCHYRRLMENSQVAIPQTDTYNNVINWVPLNGIVGAITPFNFTAIGGNLATAPLFTGNSTIWKPSDYSILSNYTVYEILLEAGVPPEAIQFIPSDPNNFLESLVNENDLAAIAFTGSDRVFENILKDTYSNIYKYNSFPRIIGETGGYNYHVVLPDVKSEKEKLNIVEKTILGAFEYSGQKCSATSKIIVPEDDYEFYIFELQKRMKKLKVSSPEEDDCFMSAVISRESYLKALDFVTKNEDRILVGGKFDNTTGNYIWPTLLEDNDHYLEKNYGEIFAPILSISKYSPDKVEEVIDHINCSRYALTTAVFTRDEKYFNRFEETCGNLYFNDKSTGSIVGQQIFGGFRKSGTNDKAGSEYFLQRLANIQTIKYTY